MSDMPKFPSPCSSRPLHAAALLLAIALLLPGCRKPKAAAQSAAEPVPVTLAPVSSGPVQRSIDVVGTMYGDDEVTVSAKVGGRIVAIYHDMGDSVPRGALLAQIDQTDYALSEAQKEAALGQALAKLGLTQLPQRDFDPQTVPAVERAKLEAANAEARFNRGRQLHDQTPQRLSDQEFSDLQTAWEVAQSTHNLETLNARSTLAEARTRAAELRQAEQMLADTSIRAPASGTSVPASGPTAVPLTATDFSVAQRSIGLGEYVREGAPLFRLIDDDPIKLRAAVPERFLSEVQLGQSVQVTVEAFPEVFEGKIVRVNPQVDQASRNFTIEVVVPNTARKLRPGGFARASVQTRMEPNAHFVPIEAVASFAGVNRVFVVTDGKAAEKIVELGQRVDGRVEIVSGLTGDESIVVSNADKLASGMPVTVQPVAAPVQR